MVRRQIHVDGSDQVVRTDEIVLLVPREIAEIQHPELLELDDEPERIGVLAVVDVVRLVRGAERIGQGRSGDRPGDRRPRGRDDADIDGRERNDVARLHDKMAAGRDRLAVRLIGALHVLAEVRADRLLRIDDARAMIHERANRQARRDVFHAAVMVAVEMGGEHDVDLANARLLRDRSDAVGIAIARVASIDQHRLARRRDEQRRLPALDVDEVDVEGFRCLRPDAGVRGQDCGNGSEHE